MQDKEISRTKTTDLINRGVIYIIFTIITLYAIF